MARLYSSNLKFLRQQNKISQQKLADELKIDRSTISRWENDEMDITVGNAIQIADFFNIPLENFTCIDLTKNEAKNYDELEILISKNKDKLSSKDKEHIKFIIVQAKKDNN